MSGKMTDYPRCKTCRYWGKESPTPPFRFCQNPRVVRGHLVDAGDVASAWYERFMAKEDFGCVHHEERGDD